ncbi:MAG: bifunctional pyr operon transcriptional regulator/uracil phosphoribosyltransferase PyrR [bacterium]|nr:bifunctional pyr operon transcriptional regulator/uracil phosphoribosyltransferase PyrR [bacterium]
MKPKVKSQLLDKKGLNDTIQRVTDNIISTDISNLVIIGMQTRGVPIAERIAQMIFKKAKKKMKVGIIDVTFYRDDFRTRLKQPEIQLSDIPFSIDEKDIVLVDDVIFTGRTVRAALAALMDYGRPSSIKLVSLVDRGHRELPIQPDFIGLEHKTKSNEEIQVRVEEIDGEDGIFIVPIPKK